jgi:chromosome segregation ATPase
MTALVEKLFGNGQLTEEVQGELRTILLQMRNERSAFERFASETQSSIEQASEPVNALMQTIAGLETRLRAVEQVAARAEGLETQQHQVSSRIEQAAQQAEGIEAALDPIRSDLEQTRHLLQNTSSLRADLQPLLDLGGQLRSIRADVDVLRAELGEAQQRVAAVREQHETVERRSATASDRLDSIEGMYSEMAVGLQSAEQHVHQLQGTMESVSVLATQVPDLRRELDTLRALRDYVSQKVSELEQQRETVDYATSQGTRLAELVQRLDRDLEAQQEKARSFVQLQEDAARLSATQAELSRELDHLAERQKEDAQADEMRRQEFQALQELIDGRIRDTIGRFEFEQERLEAATAQIADLREAIGETERRFDTVQQTGESVAALRSDLTQLSDRVVSMAMDLAPLDGYAGRMVTFKSDMARIEQSIKAISRRMEELTGAVGDADGQLSELQELSERTEQQTRDLTSLREYLDRLEQRAAKWEAVESTVAQAIDDAERRQATVDALRADFQRLLEVAKETTDAVRVITESHDEITDGRQLVDDVMTEIKAVRDESTRLESRHKNLVGIEQQIARAEALMIEIRASLETLHGQKVFLEEVIETAGSLRFQSKQAEALIGTLRDARQRLGDGR